MSPDQSIFLASRNFACIFLLMGKDNHMTMCFQSSENEWHLYDNNPNGPSFQPFDPDHFICYMTCLGVYVNITQLEEYKLGKCCVLISVWVWDVF